MDPIAKALILRKSLPLKSKTPFWAFQNRLHRPYAVLRLVENHAKNNAVVYEARRQYLVAMCAAFEIYWRDFTKVTLDSHPYKDAQLKDLRTHKFSLGDLQQILGHKLTLGELVSAAYTFQGTEVVNTAARDILDLDLFAALSAKKFKITISVDEGPKRGGRFTSSETIEGSKILRDRSLIERCFLIRHETVHDTGVRFRPSKSTLARMQGAMNLFNIAAGLLWEDAIENRGRQKSPNHGVVPTA